MNLPAFHELPAERRAEQRALLIARVGRSPRRGRALVLILAAAVLLATPALALHRQVIDFFSGEVAPERIQLDFDRMRQVHEDLLRKGYRGPAWKPVGPAREVLSTTVDGERQPLWVVQNEGGGFCFRWVSFGSCGRVPRDGTENMKLGGGGLSTDHGDGMAWVVGMVLAREIDEIELVYEDGERVTLPFVWVSPPIDAGFYAFEVPQERRVPGRLTAVIIGLDSEGNEVAHQCLMRSPEALNRSAILRSFCERPR